MLVNRLSEDPGVRVLLLEAGDRDTAREFGIPAAFSTLFKGRHDWDFTTEPETGCDGRALYWPRGKVLGGSSSLNAMIYIRGARADYDSWRDAGCTGWGYDDVLPYFRRSEHNSRGADAHHGTGGPLLVTDPRDPSPLSHDFLDAAASVGIARNPDFNGTSQDGAGLYQLTQKRGARWSAASAFLRPALKRPNVAVRTLAHAEREVLLCGGAVGTPQLLRLSGIGPAEDLRALGIEIVVDAEGRHEPAGPRLGRGRPAVARADQLLRRRQGPAQRGPLPGPPPRSVRLQHR